MDVEEAIAKAKEYIRFVFAEENPSHVGLEEVEFDEGANQWRVTVGFSRQWNHPPDPSVGKLEALFASRARERTYKSVAIDDASGEVKAIRHREFAS